MLPVADIGMDLVDARQGPDRGGKPFHISRVAVRRDDPQPGSFFSMADDIGVGVIHGRPSLS
jgi:hypothetical protein